MVLNLRVERTLDSIPSPSLPETFDGFRFGKSSLMIEKMGNICSHLFVRYEKKVVLLNQNFTSSKKRLQNEHNRRIPNLYPRKMVLRSRISVGQLALGLNYFLLSSHQYFYWQFRLKQTASRPNHTSHKKVDFNEFVQNSLGCNMGIIIFDLHGYGGCQRPKTLQRAHTF